MRKIFFNGSTLSNAIYVKTWLEIDKITFNKWLLVHQI